MKEISQLYTQPSSDPQQPPYHKFTLRGVSTDAHSVYILERTVPEDEDDILSSEAKDWQWWRIEFGSSETKSVIYEKVTEGAVLQAAGTQSANALLVYASEVAVSYKCKELPHQLYNFVRADNLNFHKELEETADLRPGTPTKRKVHHDECDELKGQQTRSPPYARSLVGTASSNKAQDTNPPDYYSSTSAPLAPSHRRMAPRTSGSSDKEIPISLQGTDSTFCFKNSRLHQEQMRDGQEMQEKFGGQSLLGLQKIRKDQDTFDSRVPDNLIKDKDQDQTGVEGG